MRGCAEAVKKRRSEAWSVAIGRLQGRFVGRRSWEVNLGVEERRSSRRNLQIGEEEMYVFSREDKRERSSVWRLSFSTE